MAETAQKIKVYRVDEDDLLSRYGIDRKQLDNYQVLCLPENLLEAASKNELYDTHDSANLCERFRDTGLKSANSSDLDLNPRNRYYVRKSAVDFWFATLIVGGYIAWDLAKGIISDYISASIREYFKGKRRKTDTSPPDPAFSPSAHAMLIVREDNEVRGFEYDGDAEAMIPSLDKKVREFFSTRKQSP
jgi:hypothetical protein